MTAAVVTVAFATPSIDLSWIPDDVPVSVVVNGGDRPVVRPDGRSVTWLEPGTNVGFGAAVNLAARDLTADRLVLVNPDCHLERHHWAPLAEGRHDEVVTIPLVSDDGPTTVASSLPGPFGFALGALRVRARLRARTGTRRATSAGGGLGPGQRAPLTTHWASGACMSLDLGRFLHVGGFSDRFFLYYEDLDLCRRLGARHPDMQVVVADVPPGHHEVAASSDASGGRAAVERARSAATYAAEQPGVAWRPAAGLARWHARRVERTAPVGPVDVVVVSLGRTSSRGERRRALSWVELAEPATAMELRLLDDARWAGPLELLGKGARLARGRIVPEAMAWSTARARRRLEALAPTTVVVLTSRGYDARLCPPGATLILDFVDRLSDSYGERARAGTGRVGAVAWRLLAAAHRRFEDGHPPAALRTAAGLHDAELLHASYVPITAASVTRTPPAAPGHDVAFVGNLRYPPNLEAVRELGAIWPEVVARRPGTRMLLAGANPADELVSLAAQLGWTLLADFPDERGVYADARVAVAPLVHASGIQTKVIDALRHAVPVLAYPVAAAGFEPPHPILVAHDRAAFVDALVGLLDDDERRIALGADSSAWVDDHLGPARWRQALVELLGHPLGARGAR